MKVKVTRPERILRVDINAGELRKLLAPDVPGRWILVYCYQSSGEVTLEWREDA